MTNQDINAAIAEKCGWRRAKGEELGIWIGPMGKSEQIIPNYCNDLNAMHEAVATLTREQYNDDEGFTYWLARITHGLDADGVEAGWNFYELQEANARQRAEAFLRTLGKWRDE